MAILSIETDAPDIAAALGVWRRIAHSSVAIAHTGTTAETTLATVVIPGGSMGPNGILRVTTLWSYPTSANAKTLRAKLGGTAFLEVAASTTVSFQGFTLIRNRNSQAIQVGAPKAHAQGGAGVTAQSGTTGTVDTSVDQNLVFSGQLGSAAETLTFESYLIEALYGA